MRCKHHRSAPKSHQSWVKSCRCFNQRHFKRAERLERCCEKYSLQILVKANILEEFKMGEKQNPKVYKVNKATITVATWRVNTQLYCDKFTIRLDILTFPPSLLFFPRSLGERSLQEKRSPNDTLHFRWILYCRVSGALSIDRSREQDGTLVFFRREA